MLPHVLVGFPRGGRIKEGRKEKKGLKEKLHAYLAKGQIQGDPKQAPTENCRVGGD